MIVSLKWLRNYVDISLSIEELAHRLTMIGLEVEGVRPVNAFLENVITVELKEVRPHPGADRLRLCTVSDHRKTYTVVCGAPNLQEGSIVPLALPGARLANGIELRETQIRGERSEGMLCSQQELGLGEDASGIWCLPSSTPVGTPLAEALDVDDIILEIGVTPNRGDCLSILGIAREVAAIGGSKLRYPEVSLQEGSPEIATLSSVTVEDPVGCPRYAARIVRGITVGPSPTWLRECLEAVGLRSINNIVDVTNYILMEMGQPLHAFDFDRLREHRIVVRRAKGGERFQTLDGVERTLFDDTLLICDGVGPVAIAGIMGGLDSEITADTKHVFIESAYFQPQSIRRSGKKLGLRSESSYRFERGIDPEGVLRALGRAAQLMQEVGGGEIVSGQIDVYPEPMIPPALTLRVDRTNRFLGMQLTGAQMAEALRRIEMQVEAVDDNLLKVIPPAFRPDISREVDLTEEIARLIGYDTIPVTTPTADVQPVPLDPHVGARQDVKAALQGGGFFEVLTYSFIGQNALNQLRLDAQDPRLHPVVVKNPLSEDQGVMRTTLIPGLLQVARHNFGHRNEDLRVFELSKVFLPRSGQDLPDEPHHLGVLLSGRRNPHLLYGGEDSIDYTDVKGVAESVLELFHLERVQFRAEELGPYLDSTCAASIYVGEARIGRLGRLHADVADDFDLRQPVYVMELDFDRIHALRQPQPMFRSLPKFPSVTRDMAIIVDKNLPVQEPLDLILSRKEPLLERIEIFDIYEQSQHLGEGKKSVGYRLIYRALDRSLTDEEINERHGRLVDEVLKTYGAVLR